MENAIKDSSFVFVYGTLKAERGNHRTMHRANGRFIGKCTTVPEWTMYHLGGYPAIVPNGKTAIKGEVYEVDTMAPIDQLEGYPHFYNRKLIETPFGPAWVYFLPVDTFISNNKVVESGEW